MNVTEIKNALSARGLEAVEVETVKNGIVCKGYQIDNGTNIKPVIYYSTDETVETFAERAAKIAAMPVPDLDTDNFINKERLLNNSVLCVQKKGLEAIVKREYLNLELYVRLGVDFGDTDNKGSIKVTRQILEQAGLTEDELFEAARANSLQKVSIVNMAELLDLPEIPEDIPFYVGTYHDRCHGAAILALPNMLGEFCEKCGIDKAYIIPSSTEEILILSAEFGDDPAYLAQMVAEINETTVDPTLRLENCVYQFDTETQEVSIAAFYEHGASSVA